MKNRIFFILLLVAPIFSNAQSWKDVEGGFTGSMPFFDGVYSLFNDTANHFLYAGGSFETAGLVTTHNFAKWDGIHWTGSNAPDIVESITSVNDTLFVAIGLKVWKSTNGISWIALPAFNNDVNVVANVNGELFAGGDFTMQGANTMRGIAKWNGTNWLPLGPGLGESGWPSYVDAIIEYQGNLVAGGMFIKAGTDTMNSIAMWDGTNWSALDHGVLNSSTYGFDVYDLFVDGNNLYAGGRFVTASGITVNGIAKWDGTTWSNLGSGGSYGGSAEVISIQKYNDTIIAFGAFGQTFGLAKWDGLNWVSYSSEEIIIGSYLNDMEVYNNEFYIGGQFQSDSNGQVLNHIARRATFYLDSDTVGCFSNCNGFANAPILGVEPNTYLWSNGETTQSVTDLCNGNYSVTVTDSTGSNSTGVVIITSPSAIVIADTNSNASCSTCADGTVTTTVTGGITPYTYQWSNGETTNSIDSLLHGDYTVTVTDGNGCATVDDVTVGFDISINESANSDFIFQIYPNPVKDELTIAVQHDNCEIEITDAIGKNIFSFTTTKSKTTLNMISLAAGVYFIKAVTSDGSVTVKRFVKE